MAQTEESTHNVGDCIDPWVSNIPWEKGWLHTPVFLLENSMDRGAWWTTLYVVAKSQT